MSSKGAVTRAFRGFSLIEYINVGRVGPGYDREARAFQRAQAEADRTIQGSAPCSFWVFSAIAPMADTRTDTKSSLLAFDPVRPRWAGRRAKRGGGACETDPGPAP